MIKIKLYHYQLLENIQINNKDVSKDKKIKNAIDRFILSVSENGYGKRTSLLRLQSYK